MYENELFHHGVKGMKWGVRRYQNKDGTLTRLGKKHQKRALETIQKDKVFTEDMKKQSKAELYKQTINKKTNTFIVMPDDEDRAKRFMRYYRDDKISDLRADAYKNGAMQVGRDYITDKSGKIILSEAGKQKERTIHNEAEIITRNDNKKIHTKYISEPERERERRSADYEVGSKYADKARSEISKNKYNSKAEKQKAIDSAFKKRIEELSRDGNEKAADRLWQEWQNELDKL